MKIDEFIHQNSLHDSYIIKCKYRPDNRTLNIGIVQVFSEISIKNDTKFEIEPTDQVEIEIMMYGVEYICHDISSYEDFEIYSINHGMIENYQVIMIQLFNKDLFKEVYIRGVNIDIQAKILNKYSYDM